MRTQDAVETFREALKLAPSEAAIYVRLYVGGPAKAGDLAGALKLHRNEVYRTATRLLNRGLIEMTMERPARYAAVQPDRVFEAEIASRVAAIDELKHARAILMALLESMEAPAPAEKRSVYKVVQGRQEIATALNHLIEHAQASITWATTFPPSVRLMDMTGGLDILTRRVAEGVKLRGAIHTTPQGWAALAPLAKLPGAQFRELDLDRDIRFVIVDERELLMWAVNDPSESLRSKEEVAIETTAPGFVQAEGVFFEQAWSRARAPP